jgi:hypothetical protein
MSRCYDLSRKIVRFKPGDMVRFKCPGCNIIGVVVRDADYELPTSINNAGRFNIKTLIKYSYKEAYSESFKTVGEVGGSFTHTNYNNLIKLSKKQIKRLGTRLLLALYE